MNKSLFFFLLSILILSHPLKSQIDPQNNTYIVSGSIIDINSIPVPYTSVLIFNPIDSSLVESVFTSETGNFQLKVTQGTYFIRFESIGYQNHTINSLIVNQSINLGEIKINSSETNIDAVEIEVEKNTMSLKLDKRVFNVGNDPTNIGSNANEILDKVPSVNVDIDGNVSLRGSESVKILIDGKPSGLTGTEPADVLQQIPGDLIDRIEVITNPSARYGAEGEVGIINIILKKEKRKGFNGSVNVTSGYPNNHSASFNLNYRKKNVNYFAGYGINFRERPGSGHTLQEYTGDTSYVYESNREHFRGGLSQNLTFGSDIFINSKNTLSLSGFYRNSNGTNEAELEYIDYDENDNITQISQRKETEDEEKENFEGTINYLKTFIKKEQKWNTTLKWMKGDDYEYSTYDQGTLQQKSNNLENVENFLFQSDYVHPIGKEGKIEMGVRNSLRKIDNDFKVEELNGVNEWTILDDFNNELRYRENIYAAYLMAGNKKDKLSYQGGLRFEHTDITTQLLKTSESYSQVYSNLFPSFHVSFEADSTNTFQVSYSKRLSRPRFRDLLPFSSYSDNRNFRSGNPNLAPEFTNSFELGYLRYFTKGTILSSLYYRYRTDVVERIVTVDEDGFTQSFPINLSTQNAFGLESNLNYTIRKWWRININANFYRAITNGSYDNQSLNSDTYTWDAKGSSKFSIGENWVTQLSTRYRGPRQSTQGYIKGMYTVDLGVSTKLMKKKATLALSVRDLFNSRKRISITELDDYYSESEFQWRSRQFLINFSYYINQNKREKSTRKNDDFSDD